MDIKLVQRGTEGELLLSGELNSVTSSDAEKVFLQVAENFDTLILNMADLKYLSSAGLRVLKKTHMTMQKKNGKLILRNVNKMIMEVLEMTGIAGILNVET